MVAIFVQWGDELIKKNRGVSANSEFKTDEHMCKTR